MRYMFYQCRSLQELYLSGFNTTSTTDMFQMFYECVNFETLNISNFDMTSTNYENMLTGWLADSNNSKRFLETANNADMGKMIREWKEIEGSYYYFDMDGLLLTSGMTPDGYRVDVNGVWVK